MSLERAAIVKVTHAAKNCMLIPDIIILTIGPSAPSTLYAARSFSGNAIIITAKNKNQYEAVRVKKRVTQKKKKEDKGKTRRTKKREGTVCK